MLSLLVVLFQNCNKEEDDFVYCTDCPIEEWDGNFTGSGTFFKASSGTTTEDVQVSVNISIKSGDKLAVNVLSPNLFSKSFQGTKEDSNHYMQFAGSNQSLDLSLYKKGTEYKITGTAKTYKIPSGGGLAINESLTFRVFKQSE